MIDLMQYALDFMAVYGLVAVFILLVLDGAALLPAVPGEVVLIIAVNQYATDVGGLVLVFSVAVAAAMVGSFIVYGLGRGAAGREGRPRKKVLGMSPKKQEKLQRVFQRPAGQSLVLFLRLFPLTRVLVSLPAGIARMPVRRFFFLSLIGMTIFYAGFLWLTYEFRDPNSRIAMTAAGLKATAYDSPAWTFIETNLVLTGVGVLVLGIILSVRASMKMAHDPDETSGSIVGTLATMILFWGGIALLVGLWLDTQLVYGFLALGGLHVQDHPLGIPYEPLSTVAGAAAAAILLALLSGRVRRWARRRNKERAKAVADAEPVEFVAIDRRSASDEGAPVKEPGSSPAIDSIE